MLLWVILAALTAAVLSFLLHPLVSNRGGAPARDAFNATVYRDQLDEIEADRARGLIGETEAEAARLEVARRLLAADEDKDGQEHPASRGVLSRIAFVFVAFRLSRLPSSAYTSPTARPAFPINPWPRG